MNYMLTQETFDSLAAGWTEPEQPLRWQPIFVIPAWSAVWWREFGAGAELYLAAVRQGDTIIGVAPLQLKGEKAAFIGDTAVCDYLDFVVAPGREGEFFPVLLDALLARGIKRLSLEHLRPEATVLTHLKGIAASRGYRVVCRPTAVSVEMALPADWEGYLGRLEIKQRHELRRKLRNLYKTAAIDYRYTEGGQNISTLMDNFLSLFVLSQADKAAFMSPRMEKFFRSMALAMDRAGLLRFGVLRLDRQPVAMVMAFDYLDSVYLYNSAYDPQYQSLSVGLLSKVLCIQESIRLGRRCFDFLKGDESYKYNIGGQKVPLYSCQIDIG